METFPEHLWRWPTRAAINRLSERSSLPYEANMQGWEWEVADPARIAEVLDADASGDLSEDERSALMETIIQSFEDTSSPTTHPLWPRVLTALNANIGLHIKTVWYWASFGGALKDSWRVASAMRKLFRRHWAAFGLPPFEE